MPVILHETCITCYRFKSDVIMCLPSGESLVKWYLLEVNWVRPLFIGYLLREYYASCPTHAGMGSKTNCLENEWTASVSMLVFIGFNLTC